MRVGSSGAEQRQRAGSLISLLATMRLLVEAGNEHAGCCNPGDFTRWKEHDPSQALDRLLRHLRVEKG